MKEKIKKPTKEELEKEQRQFRWVYLGFILCAYIVSISIGLFLGMLIRSEIIQPISEEKLYEVGDILRGVFYFVVFYLTIYYFYITKRNYKNTGEKITRVLMGVGLSFIGIIRLPFAFLIPYIIIDRIYRSEIKKLDLSPIKESIS